MRSRAPLWEEMMLGIEGPVTVSPSVEGRPVCTVGEPLTEEELSRHIALVEAGKSFYSPRPPVLSVEHVKHLLGGRSPEEFMAHGFRVFLAFLLLEGDVFIDRESGKLILSGTHGKVELTDIRRDLREIFRRCVLDY